MFIIDIYLYVFLTNVLGSLSGKRMLAYVLFVLRVHLAATTVSYLHYFMVLAWVGNLRPVKPHSS
jgi:hypothetical protein